MPAENEFKYVLRYDPNLPDMLGAGRRLEQGYLSEDSRIRAITEKDGETSYWFAYKKWTPDGLVEIEPKISKADFDRLWPMTTRRLCKTRYSFEEVGHWDVDLFGSHDNPYFVLAEAELPEGEPEPAICERLASWLIKPVGKDPAFTSYKLSDETYARNLMASLR